MTVKVSARALQELMAGRLNVAQFEHRVSGQPNPFEQYLAEGWVLSGISFQPKDPDEDDDYVTFTFKRDAAAAPLKMPEKLLSTN